ncbi:hypothetical protein CLOP_g10261 [Closterium sp. NIES-67]|nr:hypothetical protein CLOP_g6224 [Closterium sp. NIES-67]GJP80018.1 hypothetical protein CLOP_g10261 [Closterium sp. NIES-67]
MRGRSHSMADLTSATIPDNVRVSPAYSPLSQFGIPSVARYVEGSGNHAERSFYASPTAGIATAARSSSQTDPAMSISQSGRKPPSPKLAEQFKSFGCGHGGAGGPLPWYDRAHCLSLLPNNGRMRVFEYRDCPLS